MTLITVITCTLGRLFPWRLSTPLHIVCTPTVHHSTHSSCGAPGMRDGVELVLEAANWRPGRLHSLLRVCVCVCLASACASPA